MRECVSACVREYVGVCVSVGVREYVGVCVGVGVRECMSMLVYEYASVCECVRASFRSRNRKKGSIFSTCIFKGRKLL